MTDTMSHRKQFSNIIKLLNPINTKQYMGKIPADNSMDLYYFICASVTTHYFFLYLQILAFLDTKFLSALSLQFSTVSAQ